MTFKSILDDIGSDAKKAFGWLASNKGKIVVGAVETGVEDVAPITTAFFGLINNWLAEIIKSQALGTAAAAQGSNGAQKASLVLNAVTTQALLFAEKNGLSVPTGDKLNEVNTALVTVFNAFGVANPVPVPVGGMLQSANVPVANTSIGQQAPQTGAVVTGK